jgi:hypothetical protein
MSRFFMGRALEGPFYQDADGFLIKRSKYVESYERKPLGDPKMEIFDDREPCFEGAGRSG